MKEFRPPEEPALCADSSAGVPLVYSLTFSWSNRSIEMSFLAYITVIPATPSRRLVFRLRTRHIESPSGLRGIVYLLLAKHEHNVVLPVDLVVGLEVELDDGFENISITLKFATRNPVPKVDENAGFAKQKGLVLTQESSCLSGSKHRYCLNDI